MQFKQLEIPDLLLIEPRVFGDERGFFMETFQAEKYAQAGAATQFVQDNHSRSHQGVLRGLHYQIYQPQGKLVRVILGEVYDVVVDLRRSSPTFGQWLGLTLSAENKRQLWIPPGFAHGVYIVSEAADLLYKVTDLWTPQAERSLLWNDPQLGIPWPLHGQPPTLSPKDVQGRLLADLLSGEEQVDAVYL